MNKEQAQESSKSVNSEIFSLTPSALITLFEIDTTDLAFSLGLIETESPSNSTVFRFHNNLKLGSQSLFWQGNEFFAAPIYADGFEIGGKGTLPTPKLSLTTVEEGIPYLNILKGNMRKMGDLSGAKVTRIRTFAKFLDAKNFPDTNTTPKGFSPDVFAELPRDVFYIDRKSNETKLGFEFELVSIIDLEGIALPSRLYIADKCLCEYRGEGCMYEFRANRVEKIHGKESLNNELPLEASPVANNNDEKISDILPGVQLINKGKYNKNQTYQKGEFVYIEHKGIKYYFVSKTNTNSVPPPNDTLWVQDSCSKTVKGCKLRWNKLRRMGIATGYNPQGFLPYGGFPSANKLDA